LIVVRARFFTAGALDQSVPVVGPAAIPAGPMHDPPLAARDEAIFLLTAAAEIEHALMVQYLFAAYSVRLPTGVDASTADKVMELGGRVLQVAREEMGHLATVQNLLHLIGGPLNLNREHSPYASEIYPFRFSLERLSLDSLAKYVIAESPAELPPGFPAEDEALLVQLAEDAKRSNDGRAVRHVGPIFERLTELFTSGESGLSDGDFRLDTAPLQARFGDWGFEPRDADTSGEPLIIESFDGTDPADLRAAAVTAVKKIGAQGEGFDAEPPGQGPHPSESHFERFLAVYKSFRDLSEHGLHITWPVTENPNTTSAPTVPPTPSQLVEFVQEANATKGRITHPRSRAWAQLFNLRYRLLLLNLSHFLRLNQDLYVGGAGPQRGDRTARGLLLVWTFEEMRHLQRIARKLVQLPRDDPPGDMHAGPPFELPYTLHLPDREADRWRTQLEVVGASVRLVQDRLRRTGLPDEPDPFLSDLVDQDGKAQLVLEFLTAGTDVPQDLVPTDFQKAVSILEEAVRGFDVVRPPAFHGNFWADKNRDQFLTDTSPPGPPVRPDGMGGIDVNPDTSPLIRRLESTGRNRMPRFRPPVPAERIRFLRDWITGGCADNAPPGQVGVHHERRPAMETQPAGPPPETPAEPLGFAADIKPLFREDPDRSSMLLFGPFDLHRFEDVRDHADGILARLLDGAMPCDGSWPSDRIALFRRWVDGGKLP
jgi:hypothetical protein